MARYKDEQCRICRREGQKLFLKGSRCYSDKCSISRRNYAPGQNGQKKKKASKPFSAPEITAVSYPKSSPPKMATEVIEYR